MGGIGPQIFAASKTNRVKVSTPKFCAGFGHQHVHAISSDKGKQKERAVVTSLRYRAFNRLGSAPACWHARISYGAMLLQRL